MAALCAVPGLVMAPGEAGARSPERAVIRLSCGAAPEALCQALIQALAETATGTTPAIRRVAPGDERPGRPGDLGLALVLAEAAPDRLAGRLDWLVQDGARTAGPELRREAPDATLTPQSYASFARDLLRLTPEIGVLMTGKP